VTSRAKALRLSRALACLLAVGALAAACGERPPDGDAAATADAVPTDSVAYRERTAGGQEEASAGDESAGRSGATRELGTGLENFAVPDDAERTAVAETVAVQIENVAGSPLIVSARAGARPVVLDTLEDGGRLRVDLVGPPGSIEIAWETRDRARSGAVPVPAAADSVVRLPVGRPGGS
jgi:hypothetical protein